MAAAGSTADRVHELLLARGETVGCAESLTGGELAAWLTRLPGSSATCVGGVVTYATALKRSLLGVVAERVVSEECAEQMAAGARRVLGCDWALATTGVAGPTEQEGQPVGTAHVGLAGPDGVRTWALRLDGDRAAVRTGVCEAALGLLAERLGTPS